MEKHSYFAWSLKKKNGALYRDVFRTKKELIDHYTWGAGAKSEAWRKIKTAGNKPVQVWVRAI